MKPALPLLLCAIALDASVAIAQWPQWRGPERDGRAPDATLPEQLPAELEQLWKVEVGTGHSSPVVFGDKVYIHARQGDDEVVRALDLRSGSEVWRHAEATPYTRNPAAMSHGKGPKSTPIVTDDTLCTLGITGRLSCFERTTGEVRWQHDFRDRFERAWPDFGTAMSPAIFDGKLIVQVGGIEEGAIFAFDPKTGREIWSFDQEPPAYSSPILVKGPADSQGSGALDQVVTQTRNHVLSVALDSGKLLWKVPLVTAYEQNSVTVVADGSTILASGLDQSVFAIDARPDARGLWLARVQWRNEDLPMYMSSPVLDGSALFGLSHKRKGQLFCLDSKTGETRWTTEGRHGDNASLILAGDRLLVVTTDSELIVAAASCDAFTEEARYTVAESPVWAHPALVGDVLLIKDDEHLIAWAFR